MNLHSLIQPWAVLLIYVKIDKLLILTRSDSLPPAGCLRPAWPGTETSVAAFSTGGWIESESETPGKGETIFRDGPITDTKLCSICYNINRDRCYDPWYSWIKTSSNTSLEVTWHLNDSVHVCMRTCVLLEKSKHWRPWLNISTTYVPEWLNTMQYLLKAQHCGRMKKV